MRSLCENSALLSTAKVVSEYLEYLRETISDYQVCL